MPPRKSVPWHIRWVDTYPVMVVGPCDRKGCAGHYYRPENLDHPLGFWRHVEWGAHGHPSMTAAIQSAAKFVKYEWSKGKYGYDIHVPLDLNPPDREAATALVAKLLNPTRTKITLATLAQGGRRRAP